MSVQRRYLATAPSLDVERRGRLGGHGRGRAGVTLAGGSRGVGEWGLER